MRKDRIWVSARELVRPQSGRIVLLHVLSVLQSIVQVAVAVVTKYVIDAALSGVGKLLCWGVALVILLLTIVLLHTLTAWLSGSTSDQCAARMRGRLLQAAENCREEQLQQYHSGALLSRGMEDVHTVCEGVTKALPSVAGQITRLVGAFGAILLMYPKLAPVLLIGSVIIVSGTAAVRPILRRHHRRVRTSDEQVMAELQENLQQLELIQALQMEQSSLKRFGVRLKENLQTRCNRRIWSVSISSSLSLISQLGTGALLLWGAGQVAGNMLTYGGLTAMLQLLTMLRSPIVGLSGMGNRMASIEVAAERLQELYKQEQPAEESAETDLQVEAVVFENVSFHYPGDEAQVLEQFSARFPLKRWTCLTGVSGKGKSTIFKLILGLYTPQEGKVYLETDKGNIPCGRQTRALFAYVPQDFALFSGTILENLQMVAPEAQAWQRKEALSIAQADFVWELTHGEQTPVRENNTGLSKGQLQRLAIARAVLMGRPIFLLDECTSALDAQTEQMLLNQLAALDKQAILVTHRPESLDTSGNICFVNMEQ